MLGLSSIISPFDHVNKMRTWRRQVKPLYFADVRMLHLQGRQGNPLPQALLCPKRSWASFPHVALRVGTEGKGRQGRRTQAG
jgi:hypothetical protein